MNSSVDVSLVLACYNEAGLFADSLRRIREALDAGKFSYEIVFVDDASGDRTPQLIRKVCASEKHMRAIFHAANRGRGASVSDGIRSAQGRVVGYIDIDCEVSPVYIPLMVSRILNRKADVVIGRRFYRSSPRAVVREVLSRGYQWLSDRLLGTGSIDTETGYKFFHRRKILPVIAHVRNQGWFWDTEVMVEALRQGLRVEEVPVLFLRRFDKVSSVNILRDTFDYMVQLWRYRSRIRR